MMEGDPESVRGLCAAGGDSERRAGGAAHRGQAGRAPQHAEAASGQSFQGDRWGVLALDHRDDQAARKLAAGPEHVVLRSRLHTQGAVCKHPCQQPQGDGAAAEHIDAVQLLHCDALRNSSRGLGFPREQPAAHNPTARCSAHDTGGGAWLVLGLHGCVVCI